MKILILKSNISDENVLQAGIDKVRSLLAGINFPVEFILHVTDTKFTSVPFVGSTADVKTGYQINPQQILDEEKKFGDFEIDILIFDQNKVSPIAPTNPTDNGEVIQLPTSWYGEKNPQMTPAEKVDVFVLYFLHELCHERFWATRKPDITHNFYTSQFSQQPGGIISYYLFLLRQLLPDASAGTIPSPIKPYKYFSQKEVDDYKMVPALWKILDEMRELAGTPFKITSGLRTKEENAVTPGSVSNSSHLKGLAVDIACSENIKRTMILKGIYASKTAVFVEIAKKHIHIDIDKSIHVMGDTIVSNDD